MSSIKKNYMYQVLYEILVIVLPIITAPYITRMLGASQLGVYSYAVSIINIFLAFARLGVISHGSRTIAKCSKNKKERSAHFWNIYTVQILMSLISTIFYIMYVVFFIKEDKKIYVILILMIISHILDISWVYMGMENFKKTVIRNIFVKILSFILILTLVKSKNDLWIYALIMSCCIILGHIILWIGFINYFDFIKPNKKNILKEFKAMGILFIPSIAVMMYTIMDKVMLGAISGTIQVGYYEYSSAIVSIPLGFITSFGSVVLPRVSNMQAEGVNENIKRNFKKNSLMFIMFLSIAMMCGLISISRELIPIYYGKEFTPCIFLLILISIKLPFMAWANVIRSECLIPNNQDKEFIYSLFAGAGVNLIINFILIPKFDAIGAAIGTIIAEFMVCFVQTLYVRKEIPLLKILIQSVPFLIFGNIMFLIVRKISNLLELSVITLVIEIIAGALIYLFFSSIYYCYFFEKKLLMLYLKKVMDYTKR